MLLPEPELKIPELEPRRKKRRRREIIVCPRCKAPLEIIPPYPGQPVTMVITQLRCPVCGYLIRTVPHGGWRITTLLPAPAFEKRAEPYRLPYEEVYPQLRII